LGDEIQTLFGCLDRERIKVVKSFASPTLAVHDPNIFEDAEMLADRLPRQTGTLREFGNRARLISDDPSDQRQPRLVS